MNNKTKNNINLRVAFLYFLFVSLAITIILRIIYIQEVRTDLKELSQPSFKDIEAPRGNIFSDNGSLLAISIPLYDIHIDMTVIDTILFNNHVDVLAEGIYQIFKNKSKKSRNDYNTKLREAKKSHQQYFFLRNKVTHTELRELKKLPIFRLGRYKGGLIVEQRTNREKPFGLLAKRTIGILRDANPVGIERAFHNILSGENGRQLKQLIDIKTNTWMPKNSNSNKLPVPGRDIATTINIDMQDVVHNALAKAILRNNANWGCAVVMEVETGEIKAIANLKKDTNNLLDEYFNYAIGEHSEPGSTFKLASLIAGLEDGYFEINDSVDTEGGKYKFHDKIMLDSKPGGHGVISLGEAFIVSSNVGISKSIDNAYKKQPKSFSDRIYKMGLSEYLKLELPYPDNFLMKKSQEWSGVSLPWMSIGYEMQITPLHILTFYNAIANGGKMVRPIFTTETIKEGRIIKLKAPEIINPSICSKSTIKKVIPLLINVVERGTASVIKNSQYSIAGKTGTTLLDYGNRTKKETKKYQASFVGFFPAKNPRYSCIVVINNPTEKQYSGGLVAAPVFREISDKIYASDIDMHTAIVIDKSISEPVEILSGNLSNAKSILDTLGISINTELQSSQALNEVVKDLEEGIVPTLIRLNISDVLHLLENAGLHVEYSGFGSITSQSINAGNTFNKGTLIYLN